MSCDHLRHVLDALVTFGFLDQVDDVYELTETAERYLCTERRRIDGIARAGRPGTARELGAPGGHGAHGDA